MISNSYLNETKPEGTVVNRALHGGSLEITLIIVSLMSITVPRSLEQLTAISTDIFGKINTKIQEFSDRIHTFEHREELFKTQIKRN